MGHPAVRIVTGAAVLVLATLLPPFAYRRWAATELALRTHTSLPEPGLLRLIAGSLVVVGFLVAALVLV